MRLWLSGLREEMYTNSILVSEVGRAKLLYPAMQALDNQEKGLMSFNGTAISG